ncbi:MAG: AMIN domain-containing protein [Deltaproteobacteria bacterium]|nr:AMIN domain-containing protein [Deltaproteobacteria bacterium]
MINQLTDLSNKFLLTTLLAVIFAVSFGCTSQKTADMKQHQTKHITDLSVSENSESWIFTIKGDQSLTYTADKQLSPIGVVLIFPATSLDIPKRVYTPPGNEITSSILADEIVEDQTVNSRIFIALKKDTLYELIPDGAELQIIFTKAIAFSNDAKPYKDLVKKIPEPELTKKSLPEATRLITVTASPLKNNVAVNVRADGPVKNYKLFTTNNPARIVFDMYNLKSPFKKEQIIVVESKWVKRIRHFGHPDKVRLVLDTNKEYLSKYSAHPTATGLLIHVGKIPAVPDKGSPIPKKD